MISACDLEVPVESVVPIQDFAAFCKHWPVHCWNVPVVSIQQVANLFLALHYESFSVDLARYPKILGYLSPGTLHTCNFLERL